MPQGTKIIDRTWENKIVGGKTLAITIADSQEELWQIFDAISTKASRHNKDDNTTKIYRVGYTSQNTVQRKGPGSQHRSQQEQVEIHSGFYGHTSGNGKKIYHFTIEQDALTDLYPNLTVMTTFTGNLGNSIPGSTVAEFYNQAHGKTETYSYLDPKNRVEPKSKEMGEEKKLQKRKASEGSSSRDKNAKKTKVEQKEISPLKAPLLVRKDDGSWLDLAKMQSFKKNSSNAQTHSRP